MNISRSRGVILGVDAATEWLVPWWWENFSRFNALPVTFFDFGMGKSTCVWCAERATVVDLTTPLWVAGYTQVDPSRAALWEEVYGKQVWQMRSGWFKKTIALASAPYERNLWLDLDCEVLGPLDPLFSLEAVAAAFETEAATLAGYAKGLLPSPSGSYNTGVIVFDRSHPLIGSWARAARSAHEQFCGDQDLFNALVHNLEIEIVEIPPIYNWRIANGVHPSAQIVHWVGAWGKEYIRKYGGLSSLLLRDILPPADAHNLSRDFKEKAGRG